MNGVFGIDMYRIFFLSFSVRLRLQIILEADSKSRHLILRHDVDMSIEYAWEMAHVEYGVGAKSVYFIMMTSELYNPSALRNVRLLNEIIDLGHEIGVHFDPSNYPDCSREKLDEYCHSEIDMLTKLVGKTAGIVSFHRPAKDYLSSEESIGGAPHTYQPKFYKDIEYCSDSRGGWFHGHPLERKSIKDGNAMQLLTHPIWWCGNAGHNAVEKLDRLVANNNDLFRKALAKNCEPYADYLNN